MAKATSTRASASPQKSQPLAARRRERTPSQTASAERSAVRTKAPANKGSEALAAARSHKSGVGAKRSGTVTDSPGRCAMRTRIHRVARCTAWFPVTPGPSGHDAETAAVTIGSPALVKSSGELQVFPDELGQRVELTQRVRAQRQRLPGTARERLPASPRATRS